MIWVALYLWGSLQVVSAKLRVAKLRAAIASRPSFVRRSCMQPSLLRLKDLDLPGGLKTSIFAGVLKASIFLELWRHRTSRRSEDSIFFGIFNLY